jgi:hypothetical protein
LVATPAPGFSTVAGQDTTAVVATFLDTGGPENAVSDYTASIDWGDGTATTGVISGPDQNGVFTIIGDHTYAADGVFTINVTLMHETADQVMVSTSAGVSGPGGGASLASQGSTGLKELQASPVQQATPVPVRMANAPAASQSSAGNNDLYWSLYSAQRDQLTDITPLVDQWTLAL